MFLKHPEEKNLIPLTQEEFDKKMEELIQCKADLHPSNKTDVYEIYVRNMNEKSLPECKADLHDGYDPTPWNIIEFPEKTQGWIDFQDEMRKNPEYYIKCLQKFLQKYLHECKSALHEMKEKV